MRHYSMLQRRRQCGKGQRSEWASAECTMLRFRTLEQAELAKTIRWWYCFVAGKEARKIAVRPLSPAPISVAPAGTTADLVRTARKDAGVAFVSSRRSVSSVILSTAHGVGRSACPTRQ